MSRYDKLTARFGGGNPPDLASATVAGAAADTDITVTGLSADDIIVSVLAFDFTGGTVTDRTATTEVTAADTVQSSDDTTGETLVIQYWETSKS